MNAIRLPSIYQPFTHWYAPADRPTVIYGMGERYNGKLSRADLETPTAYNTYTITGLPPGAILTPSIAGRLLRIRQKRRISILWPMVKVVTRLIPILPVIKSVQDYLKVLKEKNAQ